MDRSFSLESVNQQTAHTIDTLKACNQMTARFGLTLSDVQISNLIAHRFIALKKTNRIEFGEGVLKKLIEAFCDSPYIEQEHYEITLIELQDIFYYFKGETMERLSDDELIAAMKTVYNGKAGGSLDYVAGTSLEVLSRALRGGAVDEKDEDEGEETDE